jgi:outer membrane protein OmpA-like peptidoglycan-associated protein
LQAADAAQKQADQAAAGDSSGQTAQQKPAPDAAAIEAEAQAFLSETQDLKLMSEPDLRKKLKQGRGLIDNPATPKALMPKLRQRQAQLRDALQTAAKNKDNQPAAGGQPTTDQQQTTQKPPGENQQKAEKILADDRAATALSDDQLRERLDAMRELLAASDLQRTTVKQLRLKLARDRAEYRRRVADAEAGKRPGSGQDNAGKTPELQSDDFYLKDTRRAVTLSTPELERRALVLRIAIVDTRYSAAERAAWRSMLETDRTELRRRALEDRRRREAEWRKRRDDGDLNISININIRPEDDGFGRPRPIYLAEADDDEIEQYLVAAPVRPPARRYTIDEVVRDPVVRETMPAVEIDTIKFGFNEDFVREEALEDLDRVGEVLEKIVAAHPKEVFLVEGHTDAVGSDAYNLDLSRRRAESVKQALTTYYNIEPRNLATVGYGERYLRIQTDEAEEENRRVTIRRATPLVGELN